MANNTVQENANAEDHVVDMQVNQDRLTLMHLKLAHSPQILSQSAGEGSCCIFRVPQNLVDINGRCYQPHIVSIGPYHHGDPRLRMIEEHKWRFLNGLLKRTASKGLTLEGYLGAVQPLEADAREYYSSAILFPTDEFIQMLVLDGCFLIELFRKFSDKDLFGRMDPLLSLSWVHSLIRKDLIRLENQIPFFILDCLFHLTRMPDEEEPVLTLSELTLKFFNNALQRSEEFVKYQHIEGKHLLDFLRSSFIPEGPNEINFGNITQIHCISKLRRAGIKLKAVSGDNFLVINFMNGLIEMPTLTVDDFMSAFLLNCVAYEQCNRYCPRHMTIYAKLLDCLINTAKDVEYFVR